MKAYGPREMPVWGPRLTPAAQGNPRLIKRVIASRHSAEDSNLRLRDKYHSLGRSVNPSAINHSA